MSDTVIRVENLGKKYIIGHQKQERYTALRDVIANGAKSVGHKLLKPFGKQMSHQAAEEFWALKDVSFEIKQGDRVGIIGRNGAGKSTLLKILSRITEPTKGRISIKGRVASLLEVGTGFHPELTGRENIYLNGSILGMSKVEINSKFDEIVAFAEVEKFLDTPVKRYSSGMYVRLAFAVAAHLDPEILVVDEVLAVGDVAFQKKCLGKMEDVGKQGRTVLFVSHNLATIKHLCTQGVLLERGSVYSRGAINEVVKKYEETIFYKAENAPVKIGLLYENLSEQISSNFYISRVEIFDEFGKPKNSIFTWDYIKFRIHYVARESTISASGVLSVMTLENTTLMLCSTRPDKTVSMEIHQGEHYFDCSFASWPLAAGQYLLNVGLAIPMREWLCQLQEPIPFYTEARDIFHSGMPPDSSRYIVAVPYEINPND
ncbi:MAG TPA: ABC transporter [Cyanobacteria bacterium UBA8543]|nr:ABC transporter [Cyanobacteria bacterium UBA8543]